MLYSKLSQTTSKILLLVIIIIVIPIVIVVVQLPLEFLVAIIEARRYPYS